MLVGGYPIESWWGVPHSVMVGGTPSSHGGGYPGSGWVCTPPPSRPGYPPSRPACRNPQHQYLAGVPPSIPGWGTPPSRPGWGTLPPTIQIWLGYPPWLRCGLTNKLKTVHFPILWMWVVINCLHWVLNSQHQLHY